MAACAPQPSVTLNGSPFEVTEFSAGVSIEGDEILLRFVSDPEPRAVDDEVSISVTLNIKDLTALTLQTPVAIGPGAEDAIVGSFRYGCFCLSDGTTPASTTGTITLESFDSSSISGAIDLVLRGADENGIDLGEVVIRGDF